MTNIEIEQAFHAYFDRNNGVTNTSLVTEGFTGLSEESTLELLSVVPFCHEIVGDFGPSCETKESGGINYEGSELSWVIEYVDIDKYNFTSRRTVFVKLNDTVK